MFQLNHTQPGLSAVTNHGPAVVRGCLTISINVCSTGVSFPIVVCVSLIWVVVVGAVVTAISHVVSVIIILGWVVMEWTVVLQRRNGALYHPVCENSSTQITCIIYVYTYIMYTHTHTHTFCIIQLDPNALWRQLGEESNIGPTSPS